MDSEKKIVTIFVKNCISFMKEVGMPTEALENLLSSLTSPTTTGDLQAFQPLSFWNYVYESFCDLEQEMAMGRFNKPPIPNLNLSVPQEDEAGPSHQMLTMQDPDAKFVEVEATIAVAVTTKRKTVHQAYQSGGKRFKVSKGPANFSKGKGIIIIED